jgi:hypothetical protein
VRVRLHDLVSWAELSEPLARYFSGTVLYLTRLDVPAALLGADRALWLDLG